MTTPAAPTLIPGTFEAPQPEPLTSPFPIYELYTYGTFTRATAAAAGIPASCLPKFDPTRPVKNWIALDVDDTQINYFFTLATAVEGATNQIILPARMVPSIVTQPGQAGTFNLPDAAPTYPAYEIAPVGVYENDGGSELPVNNTYFCTLQQAQQMAALLGVPNAEIIDYQPTPGPGGYAYVYAATETRRYYIFKDGNGNTQVAGILLWQMNYFGEGRPGAFVFDANGWEWVPAPISAPSVATGPTLPIPMRPLLPTEKISVELATGPMVYNSALPIAQ